MAAAASGGLERRSLGNTGENVSIVGIGGMIVVGLEQDAANGVVHDAIDRGVNFVDVAPGYGDYDGEAEEKLGKALVGYRDKVLISCKTGERTAVGAAKDLATSLRRMGTDCVDLYQLHAFMNVDDVDKALGKGGAIETLVEARSDGRARLLGFSAHSVDAAMAAMERFEFDNIMFPVNWVCYLGAGFGPQVVEAANKRGMGFVALKSVVRGPWPRGADRHRYPRFWYQPEIEEDMAALALRFALSEPVTSAIPPGDERLFSRSLLTAERFKPLSDAERDRLKSLAAGLPPLFR